MNEKRTYSTISSTTFMGDDGDQRGHVANDGDGDEKKIK